MITDFKKVTLNIQNHLRKYISSHDIKSLVLGVSGGIDSALCAVLAKPVCDEMGITLFGRSLCSDNSSEEVIRAISIGSNFCSNFKNIYIPKSEYYSIWDILYKESNGPHSKDKIRIGNLKARLRMIYLYDMAQCNNGIVLSTDNLTEYLLGFWTLHGDVGDYGMIQSLWKTEVYNLSEWFVNNELNPEQAKSLKACIECHATDGLGITNTDLDQIMPGWIGTSRDGYKEVDKRLIAYVEHGIADIGDPVIARHLRSNFKRNNPLNILRNQLQ